MQLFPRAAGLYILILFFVTTILIGGACSPLRETRSITVFAAASLQEPLTDITEKYSALNNIDVYLNLGGSLALANQIARGAPADVFISAGVNPTAKIRAENMLAPHNVVSWLTNEIVLVAGAPNGFVNRGIETVLGKTVAVADPERAPAGRYAKECLETFGLWNQMEYSVIRSANVRSALVSVETGAADLAFVYRTDLLLSDAVEVVFPCPKGSHTFIEYLVSLIGRDQQAEYGVNFIEFLNTEYVKGIMRRYGFIVIEQP